jgi:SAM-dependent methyltransferase
MDAKETVRVFFDNVAATKPYQERYENRTNINAYEIATRKQAVLSCLDHLQLSQGRLLDVGCGPAIYTPDLSARGFEVWGVDLSPEVVELAQRVMARAPGGHRTHFSVGDLEHLDFPPATFDVVLAAGVFDYVESDEAALRQIRHVLKPGGVAVVSLQVCYSYYAAVRAAVWPLRPLLRGLLGRRLDGRELCGHHRTHSHSPRRFRPMAARLGMTPIFEDRLNFSPIPFNLPNSFPQAYFRALDWVDHQATLRRWAPWLYGGYLVAVRKVAA